MDRFDRDSFVEWMNNEIVDYDFYHLHKVKYIQNVQVILYRYMQVKQNKADF